LNETAEHDTEALWARLRRRKVVQWGVAYVAAAWGLLQGLAYLSTVFQWPAELQRPATVAFIVGLPIALVLAWYHGDRGHQRVGGRELSLLTVLLLIGGGLFWWVGQMPVAPPASLAAAGSSNAGVPGPGDAAGTGTSIAVLPFVNMSEDKNNEYFSDGISEELLNVLVRVDGLGVASRTSSFRYKGSTLGTAEIAKALKVNHVLEGSVRKAGNSVRITAQLIDAVHDRHLWSETYSRELTDIFAIQEEIANAIVNALRDQLGRSKTSSAAPVTVRADTENLEAYQLYLKARELFIARKDLEESIRLFERVTKLDPGFARGWEGLAAVASVAPGWAITDRDYHALAKQAAERALELDPSLSMPWAALANSEKNSWPVDWARNLAMMDRAIAADPRNATAYLWRGISWVDLGFFGRALADFDRCLELEPAYSNALRHKAMTLLWSGKPDEALKLFEQGVAQGFVMSRSENFVGPLVAQGNLLAVQLLMDDMGFGPQERNLLIDALRHPRPQRPETVARISAYLARTDIPNLQLVQAHPYLWLGDFDHAAAVDNTLVQTLLSWERYPPAFRNSAAFRRSLEDKGVVDYWRTHGFPPQCRAVGKSNEEFTCD
jgi:TolB-like protein